MNTKPGYKTSLLAAVLAAFGATACCVVPLLLVSVGIGGAWLASLRALESWQPLFAVVAFACVAFAFHQLYIAPRRCAPDEACAVPAVLQRQRIVFWLVVAVIVSLLAFPLVAPFFY
ncbi:MAG: mercury transporter MerT [Betaproteobacteria bacterium]|nr:mercury transporter MerT [Betaproteobacteria bacterium]